MTKTFLMSVSAAALIAASGCAFAQAPNAQSAPAGQSTPGATQNAPAEKIAPTMKRTEIPDAKAKADSKMGQAEPKGPADVTAPKRAEGDVKKDDTKAKATDNKAPDNKAKVDSKMGQAEPKGPADLAAPKHVQGDVKDDTKAKAAETKGLETKRPETKGAENKPDMKPNDKAASEINADKSKVDMKGGAKDASDSKAGVTTGQAGAGSKQLTTEQRTTIRTVIKEQKVQPVTNVNFSLSVGTLVPRTMTFHPVPAEFVTIDSGWRGFEYFLIGDQIVIVNPRTLQIVAVIQA